MPDAAFWNAVATVLVPSASAGNARVAFVHWAHKVIGRGSQNATLELSTHYFNGLNSGKLIGLEYRVSGRKMQRKNGSDSRPAGGERYFLQSFIALV